MAGEMDFRLLDTQAPAKIYQAFQEGLDFKRKRAAEDADMAMKQRAQEMLNQHYATESRRADLEAQQIGIKQQELEAKRRAGKAQADATARALGALINVQTDQGWQPAEFRVGDYLGDEDGYQIMPAAMWDDGTPAQGMKTAKAPAAPKPQWQVNPEAANAMGVKPEDAQKLLLLMQDPKLFSYFGRKQIDSMFPKARNTELKPTGELANWQLLQTMPPEIRAQAEEFMLKHKKAGATNITNDIKLGEAKQYTDDEGNPVVARLPKDKNGPAVTVPGLRPAASDTEQQASGYATRMEKSEAVFDTLDKEKDKGMAGWGSRLAGALGDDARNLSMSAAQQRRRQAEDDWIRSKLRKESGAVIATHEMESERRTYFPYPGDSDAVIEQKRRARKTAIEAMKKTAGPAMPKEKGAPTKYIEIRQTADGRKLGKTADGRIEEIR